MAQTFDVVVIGAGPGGYIAAVRAAQLGLKTACIEGWKNPKGELALGGTCLNVGCIPSKALLASSEEYEKVSHHLEPHGITVSGAKVDIAKMQARKEAIVTKMVKGVEYLFKKNKIAWLQGFGSFVGGGETYKIAVGNETVEAKYVSVATGSKARHLPGIAVDNETVCDNEGALAFRKGVLWAATGIRPLDPSQTPGASSSWVITVDPSTGKILGKTATTNADFIDVGENGDVIAGAARTPDPAWRTSRGMRDRQILSLGSTSCAQSHAPVVWRKSQRLFEH
jgi:hypothetical protein